MNIPSFTDHKASRQFFDGLAGLSKIYSQNNKENIPVDRALGQLIELGTHLVFRLKENINALSSEEADSRRVIITQAVGYITDLIEILSRDASTITGLPANRINFINVLNILESDLDSMIASTFVDES